MDELDEDQEQNGGMRLYLMRHGIAINREDPDCPAEAERFLTPKGIQRTRAVARGLRDLRVRPATLLTSPYVRAVQTGEIICEMLGLNPHELRTTEALKPEAKPSRLADELAEIARVAAEDLDTDTAFLEPVNFARQCPFHHVAEQILAAAAVPERFTLQDPRQFLAYHRTAICRSNRRTEARFHNEGMLSQARITRRVTGYRSPHR